MGKKEIKSAFNFTQPFMSQEPTFCGFKLTVMRNIDGFLFPSKLEGPELIKAQKFIEGTLTKAIPSAKFFQKPYPAEIEESFLELNKNAPSCLIDETQKLTYLILGDDHIHVTLQDDMMDIKKVLEKLQRCETHLNHLFSFAFDPKKGFLTSHPNFSGHGIFLEAYLFCPHLKTNLQIPSQFSIDPLFNQKDLYVLKTKSCINIDKINLINNFFDAIKKIISDEKKKTEEDLVKNKEELFDRFSKSLALLKGAHRLDLNDAVENILTLKQGFHLGAISGLPKDTFLEMICFLQKGHLTKIFNTSKTSDDWLHERAQILQEQIKSLEMNLNFIK